jgi:uncharacterized membrane protein YoaT (DUF817 family)
LYAVDRNAKAPNSTRWQQFLDFGFKEALSCIFPVGIFISLALTQLVHVPCIHRYDLILVLCLLLQALMLWTKLETYDELKVICLFHVFGLMLELFKVHHGCWSYPEPAISKIWGVPLYSGFMYASVASYMCQAWRRFDLELEYCPPPAMMLPLALSIYANFFTEHFIGDFRFPLIILTVICLRRTRVYLTVAGVRRYMPLVVSFVLIGFFVWLAENIATYLHGWQYPNQTQAWQIVHTSKITSWSLLVIISFIGVAQLKLAKNKIDHRRRAPVLAAEPGA